VSEIYRDDSTKGVSLSVPGAAVSNVEFRRNGNITEVISPAITVPIPYSVVQSDGDFDVVWTYTVPGDTTVYTRTDTNRVVTPYFTEAELKEFNHSKFDILSTPQVVNLERLMRVIVDNITGQSFGYEYGTIVVYGTGDSVLLLPKRVISMENDDYHLVRDGYAIKKIGYYGLDNNIKVPAIEEALHGEGAYGYHTGFYNNVEYTITGSFGYPSVPDDIKLAAMTLAEHSSRNDSMWHDRYVKAISAADWSLQFFSHASSGSGSHIVDLLLSKYILIGMAII
jgi:hypothetical protein